MQQPPGPIIRPASTRRRRRTRQQVARRRGVAAFAGGRLAAFKRPRLVRYLEALPRNALGKVLKHELRG